MTGTAIIQCSYCNKKATAKLTTTMCVGGDCSRPVGQPSAPQYLCDDHWYERLDGTSDKNP